MTPSLLISPSGAALETVKTIITGETYSQCSVIATAKSSASVSKGMFDVRLRLEGWREEVVMEVIHRHFSLNYLILVILKAERLFSLV